MKFAKYTFLIAGVYGLLILVPQYFVELGLVTDSPPVIAQPGFYYGFLGVAVAFQFVFLIIATDPMKYRLMILPSNNREGKLRPPDGRAVFLRKNPDEPVSRRNYRCAARRAFCDQLSKA